MRLSYALTAALGLIVVSTLGCGQTPEKGTSTSSNTTTQPSAQDLALIRESNQQSAAPSAGATSDLPPGHPPIGAGDAQAPSMAAAQGRARPDALVAYDVPESWVQTAPSSMFRVDQYRLPGAEGGPGDGELAVFGAGIGGTADENIARWRGQFTSAEGGAVGGDAVSREEFEANGLKVTFIEIRGNFTSTMMPGSSTEASQDYRMLGGIVETPRGNAFLKAVGPSATMEQHRKEFLKFLHTMKLPE